MLRNRRRTVSAILGVLLAVTFVAGTFIAIDSSARATLDASLTGIPGDFSFYLSSTNSSYNYSALEAALLDSPGILDASLYRNVQVSWIANTTGSTNFSYRLPMYAIDPAHPPSILSGVTVDTTNEYSVELRPDPGKTVDKLLCDIVIALAQNGLVPRTVREGTSLEEKFLEVTSPAKS